MIKSYLTKQKINLQKDEHIILLTRKHWFKFVRDVFYVALGFVLALIVFSFATAGSEVSPTVVFIFAIILLLFWVSLFVVWTNHYLDLWIVTNKRIIHIEQINLFHRTRSTLRLERVQNVSIRRKGILEELLNFGTISVETAGYKTFMTQMHNIPKPSEVAQKIMKLVDSATETSKANGTLNNKTLYV